MLKLYRAESPVVALTEAEGLLGSPWKALAGPGADVADRRAQAGRDAVDDPDGYVYLGWRDGKTAILVVGRDGRYAITWPGRTPPRGNRPAAGYKRLLVDLPEELHRSLKVKAAGDGTTVAEIIRRLVARDLRCAGEG